MKRSFKTGRNFKSGTLPSEKTSTALMITASHKKFQFVLLKLIFGINTM